MDQEVRATNNQTFFNAICTPNEKGGQRIDRNTDGALLLINNYLLTYRCQRDRAAEGRQFFEVPGFLAAAGGATAAALGAGPNVAIATGATSAVLGQGKSYYAPKDKAVVFNDGLDALMCIQNQAVGIDPYTLKTLSKAQEAGSTPDPQPEPLEGVETTDRKKDRDAAEPFVTVSSERQYFDMIRTALFAVESVVAQRLSNAGTPFDADGVIAEIEKLGEQEEEDKTEAGADDPGEAGKDAKAAVTEPDTSSTEMTEGVKTLLKSKFGIAQRKLNALSDEQVGRTVIKLHTLQTKLDQCIVRAKI